MNENNQLQGTEQIATGALNTNNDAEEKRQVISVIISGNSFKKGFVDYIKKLIKDNSKGIGKNIKVQLENNIKKGTKGIINPSAEDIIDTNKVGKELAVEQEKHISQVLNATLAELSKLNGIEIDEKFIEPIKILVTGLSSLDFSRLKGVDMKPIQQAFELIEKIGSQAEGLLKLAENEQLQNVLGDSLPNMLKNFSNEINKLNLNSTAVETINNISQIINDILIIYDSIKGLGENSSKGIDETINNVAKTINRLKDLKFEGVKRNDDFLNLLPRIEGIRKLMDTLRSEDFDIDKVKKYTASMNEIQKTIDSITKLKIELDTKSMLNSRKSIIAMKDLLNQMGKLVEYVSKQKFTINTKNLKDYNDSTQGLIKTIESIKSMAEKITLKEYIVIQYKQLLIGWVFDSFVNFIEEINEKVSNSKKIDFKILQSNMGGIEDFLDTLDDWKVGLNTLLVVKYKIDNIKRIINSLLNFFHGTITKETEEITYEFDGKGLTDLLKKYKESIDTSILEEDIDNIDSVLKSLDKIKIPKGFTKILGFGGKKDQSMFKILDGVIKMIYGDPKAKDDDKQKGIVGLLEISKEHKDLDIQPFMNLVEDIVKIVNSLNDLNKINNVTLILFPVIMQAIEVAIRSVILSSIKITRSLKNIDIEGLTKSLKNLTETTKIFQQMVFRMDILMLLFIGSAPLFLLFTMAIPTTILGLLEITGLILAMAGIGWVIENTIGRLKTNIVEGFTSVTIITGLLILIAVGMITLSKLCEPIVDNWKELALGLGIIIAFIGLLALVGLAIQFALPALAAMTATVALVTAAVGCILIIVGLLFLIQLIKLDRNKIMENVHMTIDIIFEIIKSLSMNVTIPQKSNESRGFLSIIGGAFGSFVSSLFSMGAVMAATIAVAGIMLITIMLKVIEFIKLDANKIFENVDLVLDLVKGINDKLRSPRKEDKEDESTLAKWGAAIKYTMEPLFTFINALFSMTTLVTAVISVGAILLIVSMLKIIQNINLDKDKIDRMLELVTSCMNSVNAYLSKPPKAQQPFYNDIMGNLIKYISGPIGNLWNTIITMNNVAMAIINIASIVLIAKMLKYIAEIDESTITQATKGAENTIMASKKIADLLYQSDWKVDEEGEEKPWWKKMFNWIGLGDIAEAIVNMRNLATLMISISGVAALAKALNEIDLKEGGISRVESAAKDVITAGNSICKNILNSDIKGIKKGDIKSWTKTIASQRNLLDEIQSLGKSIQKASEKLSLESIMRGANVSNSALKIANDILKNINGISGDPSLLREKISLIDAMNESVKGMATVDKADVKNTKDLTDNYIRFINRLDQADLKRLNVTERMMAHWAQIAMAIDNDFDKLVLVMSDKLLPMVEKLDQTMEGVSKVQGDIIKQLTDPTLGMASNSSGDYNGSQYTPPYEGSHENTSPNNSSSIAENDDVNHVEQLDVNNNNPIGWPSVVTTNDLNDTSKVNKNRQSVKGVSSKPDGTKEHPVWARIVW